MSSLSTAAVSAIMAALTGVPGLPAPDRIRLRPVSLEKDQAVVVRPLGAQPAHADMAGMPTAWATSIAVECYARSKASIAPDVSVDAMSQAAYAAVMADPTLGGIAYATEPGAIAFDFEADGDQTACASITFTVFQRAAPSAF